MTASVRVREGRQPEPDADSAEPNRTTVGLGGREKMAKKPRPNRSDRVPDTHGKPNGNRMSADVEKPA